MLCLAQKHFNQVSESKTMSKKWLYSVGVGALLMAGEALGITVHDVLSNGFWSTEYRGNQYYLEHTCPTYDRAPSIKRKIYKDGTEKRIIKYKGIYPEVEGIRGKNKKRTVYIQDNDDISATYQQTIQAWRSNRKEKHQTTGEAQLKYNHYNYLGNEQTYYTAKPTYSGVRPIGPFVVDDWFRDEMNNRYNQKARFDGTEETATTNIISDTEAVITRTVKQSGYVYEYNKYTVEEPSWLLREYITHITTDENHVYVNQNIKESYKNAATFDGEEEYQTQYTATFKNGRFNGETESIQRVTDKDRPTWFDDYSKTKTTSVHNEPAPEYGVRPGVAVDEHTQGMLDELNRPAAVRVVVSGQEKRPISKVKRSAHEQE